MTNSGQRAVKLHDPDGFARTEKPSLDDPSEVQPRTGSPEAKDSQPFGHFASSPPSKVAEHPYVTNVLPRTSGGRPKLPSVVHRAKFPWTERGRGRPGMLVKIPIATPSREG